jgi:iron-sulfur cluster assembly protein
MITVSDNAKQQIEKIMTDENLDNNYFLRVAVKGGGCSGLTYKLDFDNQLKPEDEKYEDKGVTVVCDKKSLLYLWGTELDYTGGLNGKGFEFINPNASRTCSCGESFAV